MTDAAGETEARKASKFHFLRDGAAAPLQLDWIEGPTAVRKAVGEALNARNVAFLLGAGCSSFRSEGVESGIATMQPLADEFCAASDKPEPVKPGPDGDGVEVDGDELKNDKADEALGSPSAVWVLTDDEQDYLAKLGVRLEDPHYRRNLERLMEVLHSLHFVLHHSWKEEHEKRAEVVQGVIEKVKLFLWERCTNGAFAHGDNTVLELYEKFYRRLVFRDRSLPRPWVFTTNYDLFNERAMDRIGLPYANGFSGVVERRFNPSTFRYALAEQLDLSHAEMDRRRRVRLPLQTPWLGQLDRRRTRPVPNPRAMACEGHDQGHDLSDPGQAELQSGLTLCRPFPGVPASDCPGTKRSGDGRLCVRR